MDASIRFFSNKTERFFQKAEANGGIAFSEYAGHSNYPVLMNETIGYLPTSIAHQKTTPMVGAGVMLIYRTREIYENIIQWGILCALNENCIARGPVKCHHIDPNKQAGCSRFDQSVMNILCSNYFGFDHLKYTSAEGKSSHVKRGSFGHMLPQFCRFRFSGVMLAKLADVL